MTLIAATRRLDPGPGLAPVPAGPGGGPRGPWSGGGGDGGGGHWFDGGIGVRLPRGPKGTPGGGAARRAIPPPAPGPTPAPELDWDGWVAGRVPVAPPAPPFDVVAPPPPPVDVVEPVLVAEPVVAEPVIAEVFAELPPIDTGVVEATAVTFRSGGGLDAAALEAAAALDAVRPPNGPPSRRPRRR